MADWETALQRSLTGRPMPAGWTPGAPPVSLWGSDLGYAPDDIHCDRMYQLRFTPDGAGQIAQVQVGVVGELISPCSGHWSEPLDEDDTPRLLTWCELHLWPADGC